LTWSGEKNSAFDKAALDIELQPRGPHEFVDELRRQAQVVVTERDRDRAFELRLQVGHAGRVRRAAGERVLDDAVFDVAGAQLAAQLLELCHGKAAVVGQQSDLGLAQLLGQKLDLFRFLFLTRLGQ